MTKKSGGEIGGLLLRGQSGLEKARRLRFALIDPEKQREGAAPNADVELIRDAPLTLADTVDRCPREGDDAEAAFLRLSRKVAAAVKTNPGLLR